MMKADTLGQTAYEAYCAAREWKSFTGEPLPQWDAVNPDIRTAWIAAARAVAPPERSARPPALKPFSQLIGLAKPILFAVDSKSIPGKLVMHFIRFETIRMENDASFDDTKFSVLHPDSDPRIELLFSCAP